MDPAIAATLIGVLVATLPGVFAGAFHLLRSDLKEFRTENRADHRETNARIDRLEGKVDVLILAFCSARTSVEWKASRTAWSWHWAALGRSGHLTDSQTPGPPP